MMINSVEQYLSELKKELAGSDHATIQDALSDAEEYLRTALNSAAKADSPVSEAEALAPIVEKYGLPKEVAAAYKEIESRTPPAFARPKVKEAELPATPIATAPAVVDTRPFYARFFGIFADLRAWGALLYLIFTLGTGIIYFTWAVTGLSLSAGLLVLIVGVPIAGLFLLSVRGIALVEGRLIEALLGVRMPRRPLFSRKDIGWWQKFKELLVQRHTWTAIIYMILQMPLGIIYFTVIVTLIGTSVGLIVWPFLNVTLVLPAWFTLNASFTVWLLMVPSVIVGILLLTATMHLAKVTGRGHSVLAKAMLVRE
jgi:uncharacterized membrane protein